MLALESQMESSNEANSAALQSANDFAEFRSRKSGQNENQKKEDVEEEDYSMRLGIADHVSSLDRLQRKSGVQLSPWLWFGSLATDLTKASIDRYPDMIATNMTIRWECPACRQVLYVTREELMSHLRACVKSRVCCNKQSLESLRCSDARVFEDLNDLLLRLREATDSKPYRKRLRSTRRSAADTSRRAAESYSRTALRGSGSGPAC